MAQSTPKRPMMRPPGAPPKTDRSGMMKQEKPRFPITKKK